MNKLCKSASVTDTSTTLYVWAVGMGYGQFAPSYSALFQRHVGPQRGMILVKISVELGLNTAFEIEDISCMYAVQFTQVFATDFLIITGRSH
uniref:Uncharacterized protein n=1 Tax=Romanomermis culicivorax TaxID=13658 RepID=A0A915IT31_ROMCU